MAKASRRKIRRTKVSDPPVDLALTDQRLPIEDQRRGAVIGLILGASAGSAVRILLLDENPFFPWDTILIGAIIGTVVGFFLGRMLIDAVGDVWYGIWRG